MTNNKLIGIVVWGLSLILSMVIMLCLCEEMTTSFFVTLAFVIFAFVSVLILQLNVWNNVNKGNGANMQFIRYPALVIANVYIVFQLPICIIFALFAKYITSKVAILVNVVILIVFWSLILSSMVGREHIDRVNSRQRDHHIEL